MGTNDNRAAQNRFMKLLPALLLTACATVQAQTYPFAPVAWLG